jgi:hypothetical protein
MRLWYFDNIPDFKAEVGFKTQFNVKAPSRDFIHIWEVTEVLHHKKLAYKRQFEGLQGESYSTFTLDEKEHITKLTLIAKATQDFDATIPEFKRESCQGGWNYFINQQLNTFLETSTNT